MQGVEPAERELWDAAQVVGHLVHLVPAGSMFGSWPIIVRTCSPMSSTRAAFPRPSVAPGNPDGGGAGVAGAVLAVGPGVRRGGSL